jgi:hypothetical protein
LLLRGRSVGLLGSLAKETCGRGEENHPQKTRGDTHEDTSKHTDTLL